MRLNVFQRAKSRLGPTNFRAKVPWNEELMWINRRFAAAELQFRLALSDSIYGQLTLMGRVPPRLMWFSDKNSQPDPWL